MVVLETHAVGVVWSQGKPVLDDVTLTLTPGFYGLVGANGAGKTTLLRVLAGELTPHEGNIAMRPREAIVAYCQQPVDERDADVDALAVSDDALASELRGRLALEPDELARWPTLSPGERKRWQIGAALAREPDVLLLDEPTNHLDGDGRDRLVAALRRFRGIGLIVSHDRQLLEELPRMILRVYDARVTMYQGAYSEARATWEHDRREAEEAHSRARSRVRMVERSLDAAQRLEVQASQGRSTRSRMRNKNDSDARSILAKNKAEYAQARAGKNVSILRGELSRARAEVPEIERDRTLGGHVFASYERAPRPVLFHLDAPFLRAGRRVVLSDVRVTIGREDRVRLAGPNGAGKTTLLTALLGEERRDGRILYLPQEIPGEDVRRIVADVLALEPAARGRVLSVFAALGSDPERLVHRARGQESKLSPGEARKLALATGIGQHAWALVLDEPTNHLDLPSVERLEDALRAYPGCIVLVTHDDVFAAAVTSRVLRLEDGTVK